MWGNHRLIPFALWKWWYRNLQIRLLLHLYLCYVFSFSNVKCQRKTFVCPQGDVDCLYAPLSYSTNFITFPTRIRTPADLFTMRGPLSPYRRLVFDLKMIKAEDPASGETRVNRAFFAVRQVRSAYSQLCLSPVCPLAVLFIAKSHASTNRRIHVLLVSLIISHLTFQS